MEASLWRSLVISTRRLSKAFEIAMSQCFCLEASAPPNPITGPAPLMRQRHDDDCFRCQTIDQIVGVTMQGKPSGLMAHANADLGVDAQPIRYVRDLVSEIARH